MVSVSEDRAFHLRGRHVQHAHGQNSDAGGEHLTGAMIALMPTEDDARRLRLSGGEKAEDLHVTLYFLGEGANWEQTERESLINALIDYVSKENPGPVVGRAFGVSHWNGDGDNPCWVMTVGDIREESKPATPILEGIRSIAGNALARIDDGQYSILPDQHSPWAPHICMAYTDDLSLAAELQKRLGNIEFDRIRVAFADEYTDIALGGALTAAAGPLRRNPNTLELQSKADFVRMQDQWESAVDSALADIQPIRDEQREEITTQVQAAAELDDLDALNAITVDDSDIYTALLMHMTQAAIDAGFEQQREAEDQGVEIPEWSLTADNLTAAIGLDLLRSVARVTARIISTSFVQSGVRRALSLLGRPAVSPAQAAAEVNTHLAELSEAAPRESIGGAISAAQNEGRRTVLSVAPAASAYVASEILDRNVCGPCRSVDGRSFDTLADASEQYPSGGYRDCQGGVRCRGTIVAVWED